MPYIEFPSTPEGYTARKEFWLSEDGIRLISGWRREGMTYDEIRSGKIGVSDATFRKWKAESKDLADALRVSSDTVNMQVEEALLKRALGYDFYEVESQLVEGEMRVVKKTKKHMAPDVKACLSWLYSRRCDRWRAQQEPIDNLKDEVKTAKEILVAIKEVAASGDSNSAKPKTD